MTSERKVWYKHYPSDWRADKKLRLVSRAARSFWLDCIGLMQEEGSHKLEINGRPMTVKELAGTLGDNPRTAKKLLNELIEFGVCSVDSDGFVISRRILRDFEKAEKDKLNGRKGGNPALKTRENPKEGVNPKDKAQSQNQSQKEVDKSTSSQEAAVYEKYLEAHPKPVESAAGAELFSELVEGGADPTQIIASARAYAAEVSTWSAEAKVQQSDNFLDPARGKWRQFIPKSKTKATEAEVLDFHAKAVLERKPTASMLVSSAMANRLLAANMVTPQQLSEAGVTI